MRLGLLLTLAMTLSPLLPAASPREAAWRAVDDAVNRGLPQTALERLAPILDSALRERAWAEAAKAIGRRVALETRIQGQRQEERVRRLAAALETSPEPLRPVLHALLAHAYWGYFDQNRWRIQQRTANPAEDTVDFQTWDLRRLFAEIDRQFGLALEDARLLQATPISDYDELLEKGTVPDRYRPTLYDFLVHEAVAFYAAGEQGGARPEDAFTPTADSPLLDKADTFLAWNPTTTDTNAVAYQAIRLFQDLLRFHQTDADRSAFLDADLARLRFGWNAATDPDKDERYVAALRLYAAEAAAHELSALALCHAGEVLVRLEKPDEAHRLAEEGRRRFPESPGGRLCGNLVRQIEAPAARLEAEHLWNAPWPAIQVSHKNLSRLWFRAVAADWNQFLDRRRNRPERLNRDERLAVLRERPTREWNRDLPPTPDFKERQTEVGIPEDLRPGFYFILASQRADFGEEANEIVMTTAWVTDLTLVARTRAGQMEGWVLNARSGLPVAGARVEAWYLDRRGERQAVPARTTDAEGAFTFPRPNETRAHLFKATLGAQSVALADDLWWRALPEPPAADERTVFFTDRGLYRPGQLIQYKGVCLVSDPAHDRYETLRGRNVTVVFRDSNGRELARNQHPLNDYGSFSGNFTAPREGITGTFSLQVDGTPQGATAVQIEEYKRPKFQVTLDAPQAAPRLGDTVTLTGHALAYTGAAIDGAQVTWRVVREVRFPPWFYWRRGGGYHGSPSQEIAHGRVTTDAKGAFTVEFNALPEPGAKESDAPVFQFTLHADVTDGAGETRSSERTLRIAHAALTAELAADDWQETERPIALRIHTRTVDGEPAAAEGRLKVHRLRQPDRVHRPPLLQVRPLGDARDPGSADRSDPRDWELAEVIAEQAFTTSTNGMTTNQIALPAGPYRVLLETADRFGRKVTAELPLQVLDPNARTLALRVPSFLALRADSVEPGEDFVALWGTGYESGRALIEIERDHRIVQHFWTDPDRTQQRLRFAVTDAMRGGFTLHVTYARENRAYLESRRIEVPWTNKELELGWETFRSRLEPGQQETWTLTVKRHPSTAAAGVTAERAAAEMVATLYDASLDQFLPFGWPDGFHCFRSDFSDARTFFANNGRWFDHVTGNPGPDLETVEIRYRHFPDDLVARTSRMLPGLRTMTGIGPRTRAFGVGFGGGADGLMLADAPMSLGMAVAPAAPAPTQALAKGANVELYAGRAGVADETRQPPEDASAAPLDVPIATRKNLQETAFFLPHLTSDSNGVVRMSFKLPEALTEWRFLGFAHDRSLRSGLLEGRTVTARDLMVQPNPPRFLREGDVLEFTAKVQNQSATRQTGRVRLDLAFALDGSAANAALENRQPELRFDVPAGESRTYAWRLHVPDGCGFLTFKVTAAGERLTDGEEGALPVLSRRVLVTESLPLPIRGPGEKTFTFTSLRNSGNSTSLRHQGLTVQMVSNPAWYAVLALPYLMEYPHECAEQVFNRVYANALARQLATKDPRVRAVFDQWRGTPALDSPLEKNPDLKAVALEATPWLRQAQKESEARRNVGMLFEEARLNQETERALAKLAEMQLVDGAWPWFPGGPRDDFMTLYIVTGFGRLRQLGAEVPIDTAIRALGGLDEWMQRRWQRLKDDGNLDRNNLNPTVALYLYGRSFFLADRPIDPAQRPAFDYWIDQARRHWLDLEHRLPQGHVALGLWRCGNLIPQDASIATPQAILRSLRERSVTDAELGRFWREDEHGWSWFRAPIETQALMIELFEAIGDDPIFVDDLKTWLLKQKQTQDWKTTKATADAVYALLRHGADLLSSTRLVEVDLGNLHFPQSDSPTPNSDLRSPIPEPGTGFYEARIPAADITAPLSRITVRKSDAGLAWGSVHWQYLEDVDKVPAYAGTPLTLRKAAFTRVNTRNGRELVPVQGPVKVGDELVIRVELRVDRDMEYVHLKDERGSGTEPVNVLSGYRFQDGLGYYESTRDTATHFFIGYLPKGTYVFEYPLRVQHRGQYPAGLASVQCLYAPEFNSHSASLPLVVE